jgi:hypothetical protein
MGCGASTPIDTNKMSSVAPTGNLAVNSDPQRLDSTTENKTKAALAMKRKNGNVRGTQGYNVENDDTPDMTPIDKPDEIRDRLITALTKHWLFESSMTDETKNI